MEHPGSRLYDWRLRHRGRDGRAITQAELAAQIRGVDASTISKFENGKLVLGLTRAERIASILKRIDPSDWLTPDELGAERERRVPAPSTQALLDRLEELSVEASSERSEMRALLQETRTALERVATAIETLAAGLSAAAGQEPKAQ